MNVEKESIFFCLRFFPAYLILKPGSDFGEEVIRTSERKLLEAKRALSSMKNRSVSRIGMLSKKIGRKGR